MDVVDAKTFEDKAAAIDVVVCRVDLFCYGLCGGENTVRYIIRKVGDVARVVFFGDYNGYSLGIWEYRKKGNVFIILPYPVGWGFTFHNLAKNAVGHEREYSKYLILNYLAHIVQ